MMIVAENKKHYSDEEIQTTKTLDEIGFYGVSFPVITGAKQRFNEMFAKNKVNLMDTLDKLRIQLYAPIMVMRKPWHIDARNWMVEAITDAINEGVDGSEWKKVEQYEVRALLDAFETIRLKIGPGMDE